MAYNLSWLANLPSFYTTFPADENPISEGGAWTKAANAWQSIRTSGGNALAAAYSNQTGHTDDAYAYLQNWAGGDNYRITATVYWPSGNAGEVEILFRLSDDASNVFCYETLHNVSGSMQLVRWKGPLDQYEVVYPDGGGSIAAASGNGAQFQIDIVGNLFSYRDRPDSGSAWTERVTNYNIQTSPNASGYYATGKPGIGIYVLQGSGNLNTVGLSDYSVMAL
jgi:hypothetical protein